MIQFLSLQSTLFGKCSETKHKVWWVCEVRWDSQLHTSVAVEKEKNIFDIGVVYGRLWLKYIVVSVKR